MAIMRIVQDGPIDEDGRPTGEPQMQEVHLESVIRDEFAQQRALMDERQRNREAERYGNLNPLPRINKPVDTSQGEPTMAEEKSEEQKARESIQTSGQRMDDARQAYEQKLEVENVQTVSAGVAKLNDGTSSRLVPSAQIYQKEPQEGAEGMPIDDNPPFISSPANTGPVGRNTQDEAELRLGTSQHGDEYSTNHAAGTSDALASANVSEEDLKAAEEAGVSEEERQKMIEQGREQAQKLAEQTSDNQGPSKAQQEDANQGPKTSSRKSSSKKSSSK